MKMHYAVEADAKFVLDYFRLPVRPIAHTDVNSKGGLSLAVKANPHGTLGKKCRRRWMNIEVRKLCLEQLIAKICRMICHNTGSCDIRVISDKHFT